MDAPKTLREAILFFADYENCRKFMVAIRWEDGVVRCPYCNSANVLYMPNAKQYFCRGNKHPKQKFSLKIGTIFEDSPIGLEKWLPAYWLLANCKNRISSYELARAVGVTQKSAWFMLHRIRYSLNQKPDQKFEGGPVEVDEAYIGGEPKNKHKSKREPLLALDGTGAVIQNPKFKNLTGRGTEKVPVFGMLDRETRQVRAHVIPQIKRETLMNAILENVEKGSKVYSDSYGGYKSLAAMEFVHDKVNHVQEYVRGEVHTNSIENFWSLLKRTLKGTYVAVEPFHLDQYVGEQVFRFNNRKDKDDYDRFSLAVSQATGKRLTLAELTGKNQRIPF